MDKDLKFFLQYIKNLGLIANFSITYSRECILKTLFDADKPINADEINKCIKNDYQIDISKPTIYKFLDILELNHILEVNFFPPDKIKHYNLKNLVSQNYIYCQKCNTLNLFKDDIMQKQIKDFAEKNSFSLENQTVTLYGICKECQ